MAEGPLSHDEFFARLSELFASRRAKGHGTVLLTQKRLTYGNESHFPSSPPAAASADGTPFFADLHPTSPLPVLVRATNSKSKKSRADKVKLSTVVQPGDLESFYVRYADVCKLGMVPLLKPRDRSKKKAKAKKSKKGGKVEAGK